LSSPKIKSQLKESVNLEVRVFTIYGTSYRGVIKEVTNDDVELVEVKVCDSRNVTPGSFYYPKKAIVLLSDIAVVEGGIFDEGEDADWLETN